MPEKTAPHSSDSNPPVESEFTARLIILRGPQAGETVHLQPGVNLFGRDEGIILRDSRVSRRHAKIEYLGSEFVLADLGSTNGTFVNGNRVMKPVKLQHGDTIRMGDTILNLRLDQMTDQDPATVGARTPETKLAHGESTLMVGRLTPNAPEAGSGEDTERRKK